MDKKIEREIIKRHKESLDQESVFTDEELEKKIVEYWSDMLDKDCVLPDEKYEKFKRCWEYATEIVDYFNDNIDFYDNAMELSYEFSGTCADIIIVAEGNEISTIKKFKKKWDYILTSCDQFAFSTINVENFLDVRVRLHVSFNTQWIDPK